MSILANLTPEQIDFLKKLVRHMDRGLLSLEDSIEVVVTDHNVTPPVAEKMLDEARRIMSSRS
jgi:hypothetical protein